MRTKKTNFSVLVILTTLIIQALATHSYASLKSFNQNNTKLFSKINNIDENDKNNIVDDENEQLTNPRLRIRTGTKEFFLGYKSCVKIKTKTGMVIGSNISQIEKDYLILQKNNTKIYYNDISELKVYFLRRWYPILTTLFIPAIPGTIFWFVSAKKVCLETDDCRKKIIDIRVVNKYSKYEYGKDKSCK